MMDLASLSISDLMEEIENSVLWNFTMQHISEIQQRLIDVLIQGDVAETKATAGLSLKTNDQIRGALSALDYIKVMPDILAEEISIETTNADEFFEQDENELITEEDENAEVE